MSELLTHYQEDVLADIMQSIRLQSTLYCRANMSAPWGFSVSRREVVSFHVVTGGTCWLTVEGIDKPVLLTEGDLVELLSEPRTSGVRQVASSMRRTWF